MTRTLVLTTIAIFALSSSAGFGPVAEPAVIIVKADSLSAAKAAVAAVEGTITHELGVIRAVAAGLTAAQLASLREDRRIRRIYANDKVETAGRPVKDNSGSTNNDNASSSSVYETHYPSLVGADALHDMGIIGDGIGIAVLDTGLWKVDGIKYDETGSFRINALYNAMTDQVASNPMSGDDPAAMVRISPVSPSRAC